MTPQEQLADELMGIFDVDLYRDEKEYFMRMVSHVQKLLIEARLQETARYLDVIGTNNEYYTRRTTELRKQLNDLESVRCPVD